MTGSADNLHPDFDRLLGRAEKEGLVRQRARVVWLYGLSGSGKTTLADALERRLHAEGHLTVLLDGDNVRAGLNRNLGFSDDDRAENIRRIAEVSKLFVQAGVVVINSFITPRESLRRLAREIIGSEDLIEVYVEASFETCARRDPKGLYAKADVGKVSAFTGRDAPFDPPAKADLVINTETLMPEECVDRLYALVKPRLVFGRT